MSHSTAPAQQQAADHGALHRRLQQLRTTMGESTAPVAHQAPAAPPVIETPVSPKAGTQPVLLIGSALLIAGALWWAFGSGAGAAATPAAADSPPTPRASATAQPSEAQTAVVSATPVAPLQAQPALNEQQIRDALENWRLDWSRRDIDAYLQHYSPLFVPANGQTRAEWEATRRQNISRRPAIRVEVNDLRIEPLDQEQIRLTFLQNYISGTYQETAQPKTLRMVRAGTNWLIVGEWQGPEPISAAKNP